MLTDSRLHPRVVTEQPVTIGIPGDKTGAKIVDISLGGITIKGNLELAKILKLDPEDPKALSEHVVSFDLPNSEFSEICRLVHVRRLSQNDFEFGMKFVDLNPQDTASISDYINNHLTR